MSRLIFNTAGRVYFKRNLDTPRPGTTHSTRMAWWRRWFGQGRSEADRSREAWRAAWAAAVGGPDEAVIEDLSARLAALNLPPEETELEQEMLDALAVLSTLARADIPVVETGHRVIGAEACHFSAPASMPDEPSQPGGRLFLTPTRAVFAGGGRPLTIPWHAIVEVQQSARDVLLVRADRERLYRFRTNSYADALCGAHLARRLMPRTRKPERAAGS